MHLTLFINSVSFEWLVSFLKGETFWWKGKLWKTCSIIYVPPLDYLLFLSFKFLSLERFNDVSSDVFLQQRSFPCVCYKCCTNMHSIFYRYVSISDLIIPRYQIDWSRYRIEIEIDWDRDIWNSIQTHLSPSLFLLIALTGSHRKC